MPVTPPLATQTLPVRLFADSVLGCNEYPRPGLTVDAVMVTGEERPQVLLIRRKNDPFAGSWALPGGFVDEGEDLGAAAARELEEETGLSAREAGLTQVGAFGEPGRDPRGWCVSVAYAALLPAQAEVLGADDAEEAQGLAPGGS
ncbi:ADP-ribose pyrophosphatase [Auxenochlorella protothecoides]|uniref:ADP-ribose pyrophosphatase n=1 Tax=Auxenochlorella protothecoides TaxID=3075 RepID=A0A087SBF8_AUXPR|nr:ADP-ribose pyrophosphatase [Auxenochlorella protothecoides]KFM23062.1 ADP-ribose pyrophosphatase [Auxenochlorella protothecoides]